MNVLNGEDYSKLKAIVKESVKDVLSDNKILISTAFAALVQTVQNDPEMIKAIYNISIANDDKDNKNNNNNIVNYLELNRDRILNLGQKNYENLVEAFTKNAIDIAASASSSSLNSTLSSMQSSSTFPNSYDLIDTFRKEESESFDNNSNGDIAD